MLKEIEKMLLNVTRGTIDYAVLALKYVEVEITHEFGRSTITFKVPDDVSKTIKRSL